MHAEKAKQLLEGSLAEQLHGSKRVLQQLQTITNILGKGAILLTAPFSRD